MCTKSHVRIGQHVLVARVPPLDAEMVGDLMQPRLRALADGQHVGAGMLLVDGHELRAKSETNHGDVQWLRWHDRFSLTCVANSWATAAMDGPSRSRRKPRPSHTANHYHSQNGGKNKPLPQSLGMNLANHAGQEPSSRVARGSAGAGMLRSDWLTWRSCRSERFRAEPELEIRSWREFPPDLRPEPKVRPRCDAGWMQNCRCGVLAWCFSAGIALLMAAVGKAGGDPPAFLPDATAHTEAQPIDAANRVDFHVFYVAVDGNDAWSSLRSQHVATGNDGPLATLDAALNASHKAGPGSKCIMLGPGRYYRQQPLVLQARRGSLHPRGRRWKDRRLRWTADCRMAERRRSLLVGQRSGSPARQMGLPRLVVNDRLCREPACRTPGGCNMNRGSRCSG